MVVYHCDHGRHRRVDTAKRGHLNRQSPFRAVCEKAKRAVGWRFYELDGSHSPMELLERILQK